jgi:alkylresorcinol/alkylpyrone synthase
MGWDLVETGLKVQLSRSVPNIVRDKFRDNLEEACNSLGLDFDELEHFVLHPGGSRVLDAFEEALGLQAGGLTISRDVLRDCGNMSSVTVLFILERFLDEGGLAKDDLGVLSALGPGFSAEHVFFRC